MQAANRKPCLFIHGPTSQAAQNDDFDGVPGYLAAQLGGACLVITCLQSDVYVRAGVADLARQLSASGRGIPLPTPGNGTLMAR